MSWRQSWPRTSGSLAEALAETWTSNRGTVRPLGREVRGVESGYLCPNQKSFFEWSRARYFLSWCSGFPICKRLLTVTSLLLGSVRIKRLMYEAGQCSQEQLSMTPLLTATLVPIFLTPGSTGQGTWHAGSSLASLPPAPLAFQWGRRSGSASRLGRLLPSDSSFVPTGSYLCNLLSLKWR